MLSTVCATSFAASLVEPVAQCDTAFCTGGATPSRTCLGKTQGDCSCFLRNCSILDKKTPRTRREVTSPKYSMFFFFRICFSESFGLVFSCGFFQEKQCHYTNGLAPTAPWPDRLLHVHVKALKSAPSTASCLNPFLRRASQPNTNSQR